MIISSNQLKGIIKNKASGDAKKAESLVRLFFMEHFLERVAMSAYKDSFVLKGGMLASSLLGIDLRTTMDIDTSVRALTLGEDEIQRIVLDICSVDIEDNITYKLLYTETIMDDFDYPGIRVHLEGEFEKIRQPIKIDVSTDDVITPRAIEYKYKLMFEERTIELMAYNTETLLAEKLQTVFVRGIANTRLRDFYDIYLLISKTDFSWKTLIDAFTATCKKRDTIFDVESASKIEIQIENDSLLEKNWELFKKKNSFVDNVKWKDVLVCLDYTIKKLYK